MNAGLEALPDDIDALKAALIVARAEAAAARAQQSDDQPLIAHLKLQIEKLNRDLYGPRSERTARLLDQLELTVEDWKARRGHHRDTGGGRWSSTSARSSPAAI